MQILPIGTQSFVTLRQEDYLYVFEFKVQSSQENAQSARQQIRDKHDDAPYRNRASRSTCWGLLSTQTVATLQSGFHKGWIA